jgi:serine/threonine-protein kinase
MGEVWRAYDTSTKRVVAIKVLPAQLATDPIFEQRFRREAYAAARLSDPHVVPIHNYGEIDGRLYVDMRLIEGHDLDSLLADGPLFPPRAVRIVAQIAKALHAAHKVGLVHRDVKPPNILLAEDDFAYLIDFGIARAAGESGLTTTGGVIGTLHYMAPERFTTPQADARSDIYALTCVLYECLTGMRPFPGDSLEQQLAGHLSAPPPRPSITRPGVPEKFDAVIATGMAKEPDKRYATTAELARAAHLALTPLIPRPKPTLPAQPSIPSAPVRAGPATVADPDGTQSAPRVFISAASQPPPRAVPARWRETLERLLVVLPWWQRNAIAVSASAVFIAIALALALAERPWTAGLFIAIAVALDLTILIRPDRAVNPPQPWWRRSSVIISAVAVLIILAIFIAVIIATNALEPRLKRTPVPPIYVSDEERTG